jgi:hypothetical protein
MIKKQTKQRNQREQTNKRKTPGSGTIEFQP